VLGGFFDTSGPLLVGVMYTFVYLPILAVRWWQDRHHIRLRPRKIVAVVLTMFLLAVLGTVIAALGIFFVRLMLGKA